MSENRFRDQKLCSSDISDEVWVLCPKCQRQAIASKKPEEHRAVLVCRHCGYNHAVAVGRVKMAAHAHFGAKLWFTHPYRGQEFRALNPAHLDYLEAYIGAGLREHRDRTHFTLLERLPRFYHKAKHRAALLKIIERLRSGGTGR